MPNAQKLWQDFISSAGNGNIKPRAARQFIGREELLQFYFELKDRAREERFEGCYVVNFYGEPGIGKSTLLRQIESRLQTEAKDTKEKPPVILRADFDSPALSSVQDVLGLFRTQLLSQVKGAAFPFFDMAIHLLVQKQGRRLLPDEEKELLMDNPVLSFAMGTVADIVGLGTVLGAVQAVLQAKDGAAAFLRDRKKYIRRTYEEIQNLDVPDLIRRLPWYFAMDVNATKELPAIFVFLDTYERAAGQFDGAGYNAGFDESWLTGRDGLIASLGNAVFAIAGREPLPCGNEDDGWHIVRVNADTGEAERYQRKLDVLSETESMALLAGCGMSDELAGAVCRLTGGDPVFLELCLDQYDHLIAAGETPAPDSFGTDTTRLVERHTRYLPAHLREPLFLLAAMGRWTDAQYDKIRETAGLLYYPISDSMDYRRLTSLSYIWPDGDGWAMRDKVAEALSRELTFGIRSGVLDKIISLASAEETAFRLHSAEAWYAMAFHMWEAHRDALPFSRQCTLLRSWGSVCGELQELLLGESRKRRFAESGEKAWTLLLELCENEQNTQGKPAPDFCRAQYELGRHYWDAGEWELCAAHFRRAAQGYRELGTIWSTNTMLAEGALHAACDQLGDQDAAPGDNDLVWEYTWTGTETVEDLELLQDWAYFRLNSNVGNMDGYYFLMRKIAGAYRALDVKPSRAVLASEIQTIGLYVQRQLDPQLLVKCANWDLMNPGPDSEEWDWDTPLFRDYSIGAETTKTCMELAERAKRVLAPTDPLIAFALDALARAQEAQCLYHLAIPIRQEALTLFLAAYGPDAKDTLNQEGKLIDAYRKAKKPDEAIRLQQNRLEYARETMDADHQKRELIRTADLYRHLLSAADSPERIQECFTALNGFLEELRALPGIVLEENIVPWGRAAIWCLNHSERDIVPDTEQFVSAVVDFCKNISHMVLYMEAGRTVAQVILEGMEGESGWRLDLWENCQPEDR